MNTYSDRDLESAACHNNSSFISDWFRSLNDEERMTEACRAKQGMVLRTASLHHSFGVARVVLQLSNGIYSGYLNKMNFFVATYIA